MYVLKVLNDSRRYLHTDPFKKLGKPQTEKKAPGVPSFSKVLEVRIVSAGAGSLLAALTHDAAN